jgi:hypothetical protein
MCKRSTRATIKEPLTNQMRLIYPINQSDVPYSKPVIVIGSGSDSGSQI